MVGQQADNEMSSARRIDAYLGERMRLRRVDLGWTQEALAAQLEISYQQIQKYESGSNRISASRLYEIAQLLETDIGYFFDGAPDAEAAVVAPASSFAAAYGAAAGETDGGSQPGRGRLTMEMVRHFKLIADPGVKSALSNLAKELAKELASSATDAGEPPAAETSAKQF